MKTSNLLSLRQVPSLTSQACEPSPAANWLGRNLPSLEARPSLAPLGRARSLVRSLGFPAATEALRRALRPARSALEITYWQGAGGHRLTFAGTEQKPGVGKLWTGTLPQYAAWLQAYARELHPKGTGRCLSHSRSLHGGSSDAEMLIRTAAFLDCDGLGPWQPIHALLSSLGIAHVISVKASDPTSWHLTLFLAEPLANPHPGDADATRAWKARVYQPAIGWILGLFSELAGLRGDGLKDGKPSVSALGFDPKADRLQQLEYAYCRRRHDDPIPEIVYSEGQALDWDALLEATGYQAPGDEPPASGPRRRPPAARTRPRLLPEHEATDTALVENLARADSPAWRSGGLDLGARALGGALGSLGFAPPRAAAVVYAAAVGAGVGAHATSMAEKAERAAARALAGDAVPQLGHLARHFPELHAVVQRHVPLASQAFVSATDEANAVPLLSAEQAQKRLAVALHLESGARLVLASPGLGKSHTLRQLLAATGEPVALYVPTHDLADQMATGLATLGVPTSVPRGVTRLHVLPSVGGNAPTKASACVQHDVAEALVHAGASPRRLLCSHCPQRDHHPTGGSCPAYADGASPARVSVLQQALLARSLATLLASAEPVRLAVVDEVPTLFTTVDLGALPASALALSSEMRRRLPDDVHDVVGPVFAALASALVAWAPPDADLAPTGTSLRALLSASGAPDVETMLEALRSLDPDALLAPAALSSLARTALDPELAGWALSQLTQLATLHAQLGAWIEAAHAPDAPCLLPLGETWGLVVRARWTREAQRFVAAGGRLLLLDATANPDALRAALGDTPLDVVRLDVRDAPGVARSFIFWGSGARSRHSFDDKTPKLEACRGALRHLAQNAALVEAKEVGLLTDKPLALELQRLLSPLATDEERAKHLPRELLDLRTKGVHFEVGWYGAQRGLDRWAECDVLATLGDPWPWVPGALAHARALGLEPEAFVERLTLEELTQAWGRARAVHRTTPVQILHYGTLAPDPQLAPQWLPGPADGLPTGRPRALDASGQPLAPWDWPLPTDESGESAAAHARRLGVNRHTYRRRLLTSGLSRAAGRGVVVTSGEEATLGGAQNPLGDSGRGEADGSLAASVPVNNDPLRSPQTRGGRFCAPPSVVRKLVGSDPPPRPANPPRLPRVVNVALLAMQAASAGGVWPSMRRALTRRHRHVGGRERGSRAVAAAGRAARRGRARVTARRTPGGQRPPRTPDRSWAGGLVVDNLPPSLGVGWWPFVAATRGPNRCSPPIRWVRCRRRGRGERAPRPRVPCGSA